MQNKNSNKCAIDAATCNVLSSYSFKHLILHQAYQIQPANISKINLISKVKLRMSLLSSIIVYVFVKTFFHELYTKTRPRGTCATSHMKTISIMINYMIIQEHLLKAPYISPWKRGIALHFNKLELQRCLS